ncbi:MAG TPA: Ig-like domain-containing protein, partial [Azospirillaceae bacterium]|nr:Ig-like domain-containing protein [Azospirillaceae bacterium]
TADGDGAFTIALPTGIAAGGHSLTVQATDKAGNSSTLSATYSLTIDRTAPTAPTTPVLASASDTGVSQTDGVTSDSTPTLTGTAEANATVVLFDGATAIGSTTAAGDGSWSLTTTALATGGHTLTVKAGDTAGNTSGASPSLTITVDTTAPVVPSAPVLGPTSDTGASSTDKITSDGTPTVTGTGEANTTITLFDAATPVGSTTVAIDGTWSITTSDLSTGTHTLTAKAGDTAGNSSVASSGLTITVDATAPAAPLGLALAAGSDTGTSAADRITRVAAPTVTGTAEAGATVTLFDGAVAVGSTTAAGNGTWSIQTSTLADGVRVLTATATDTAGNVSPTSSALSVTIDTTAPATPSTPVLAIASDTGPSNFDGITSDSTPTFGGTSEANATVVLFDDADSDGQLDLGETTLATAIADGAGAWSATLSSLADGGYAVRSVAVDKAGNTSAAASESVALTIDTAAPTGLTGTLAVAQDADAGAVLGTVAATDASTVTYALDAGGDASGRFAINGSGTLTYTGFGVLNKASNPTHTVRVIGTDAAGKATAATTLTVAVTSINVAPEITGVTGSVSYTENAAGTPLYAGATVADIDVGAGVMSGGRLTLQRQGGANGDDVFAASGTLDALDSGAPFRVGGTVIGYVNGNEAGLLEVTLGDGATMALLTQALRQITYANASDTPPATVIIDLALDDANSTGTSGEAQTATVSRTITLTATNDAPRLAGSSANQTGTIGTALEFTLPAGLFSDPEGQTLTYAVSGLPSGLSFDPATLKVTGTPTAAGDATISVTASDGALSSDAATFTLTVSAAPVVAPPPPPPPPPVVVTPPVVTPPLIVVIPPPTTTPDLPPPLEPNKIVVAPPAPTVTLAPAVTEDGASVQRGTGADASRGGQSVEQIVIAPVTAARQEVQGTPTSNADIRIGGETAAPTLVATLPTGVGLQVVGPATTLTLSQLAGAAQSEAARISTSSAGVAEAVAGNGLSTMLPSTTPVTLRTVTPTVASGATTAPAQPIVISVPTSTTSTGTTVEAVVIDTRSLPSGSTIELRDVDYAVITGSVFVIGGTGSNVAIGDDAQQFIMLGADDDTLRGGGGNDTVGSADGDDMVYGDEGEDSVFGGANHDQLSGGRGNDTIDGGSGLDTVRYTGKFSDYSIVTKDGITTVTALNGMPEGTDQVRNVERLRFADRDHVPGARSAATAIVGRDFTVSFEHTKGGDGFKTLGGLYGGDQVLGAGDFDGDGRLDLLASDAQGRLLWNDPDQGTGARHLLDVPAGGTAIAIGNLAGGVADEVLLLNRNTGALQFLDAATGVATHFITPAAGWSVAGTGNIDGKAADDILFQHTDGRLIHWNGTAFRDMLTLAPGWTVVSVGNLSDDAADEVLLQSGAGQLYSWNVNRGAEGFRTILTPGAGWSMSALADLDGDGFEDLVLRNASTGATIAWEGLGFIDLTGTLGSARVADGGLVNVLPALTGPVPPVNAEGSKPAAAAAASALPAWGGFAEINELQTTPIQISHADAVLAASTRALSDEPALLTGGIAAQPVGAGHRAAAYLAALEGAITASLAGEADAVVGVGDALGAGRDGRSLHGIDPNRPYAPPALHHLS